MFEVSFNVGRIHKIFWANIARRWNTSGNYYRPEIWDSEHRERSIKHQVWVLCFTTLSQLSDEDELNLSLQEANKFEHFW